MEWSGVEWSGAEWSGVEWTGLDWSGLERSGVEWSGVEWSGVKWSRSGVDSVGVGWGRRQHRTQALASAHTTGGYAPLGLLEQLFHRVEQSTQLLPDVRDRRANGAVSLNAGWPNKAQNQQQQHHHRRRRQHQKHQRKHQIQIVNNVVHCEPKNNRPTTHNRLTTTKPNPRKTEHPKTDPPTRRRRRACDSVWKENDSVISASQIPRASRTWGGHESGYLRSVHAKQLAKRNTHHAVPGHIGRSLRLLQSAHCKNVRVRNTHGDMAMPSRVTVSVSSMSFPGFGVMKYIACACVSE